MAWLSLAAGPLLAQGGLVGLNEFQVNSFETGDQRIPSLVLADDEGLLVLWQSINQDGPGWGLYGQRLGLLGELVGGEFRLNDFNDGNQESPRAARLADGRLAAVWLGPDQRPSAELIYWRGLSALGVPEVAEQVISERDGDPRGPPRLAALPNGRVEVAWEQRPPGRGFNVYSRQAGPQGQPLGAVEQVNLFDTSAQRSVDLASDDQGRVVLTWQSANQDGNDWGVFARCRDASGMLGTEFQVNQSVEGGQTRPRVARHADGPFAIAWQDNLGFGPFVYQRVMVRAFAADCQPLGPEWQVNIDDEGTQDLPVIAALADGTYVVVWQDFPPDFAEQGIRARRLSAIGEPAGQPFRVSQETAAYQDFPEVQALPDGGFAVVWETLGQDASGFAIFARLFVSPDSLPPVLAVPVGGGWAAWLASLLLLLSGLWALLSFSHSTVRR